MPDRIDMPVRLGKRPAVFDPRTPRLEHHRMASAPPPVAADWTRIIGHDNFILGRNQEIGDCTSVGIANAILAWTGNTLPVPVRATDEDCVAFYSETTGYNPIFPFTDRGAVELDVLKYLSAIGFRAGRLTRETAAFASFTPRNTVAFRNAVAHLGCVYLGLDLPLQAQTQSVWTLDGPITDDPTPGSWGGHCVIALAYSLHYVSLITWGKVHLATWPWLARYCDEAYALFSSDWLKPDGLSPEGLNKERLLADMANLAG